MIYSKFPVIFLTLIANEPSNSTNRHIAKTILAHINTFESVSLVDLADLCNVGTGSISRFCKEIGLHGFAELKELILSQYHDNQNHQHFDAYNMFDISNTIQNAIGQAMQSVDQDQLKKLVNDIYRFNKVYAAGLLKANNAAIDLQADLFMCGKYIDVNSTYKEQMDHIIHARGDELIIIFSYTGSYFEYERFGELGKNLYRPKIWMISGKKEPVPDYVDEILYFESDQSTLGHPFQLEAIASLIHQVYQKTMMEYQSDETLKN